jgi:hypothetical protein
MLKIHEDSSEVTRPLPNRSLRRPTIQPYINPGPIHTIIQNTNNTLQDTRHRHSENQTVQKSTNPQSLIQMNNTNNTHDAQFRYQEPGSNEHNGAPTNSNTSTRAQAAQHNSPTQDEHTTTRLLTAQHTNIHPDQQTDTSSASSLSFEESSELPTPPDDANDTTDDHTDPQNTFHENVSSDNNINTQEHKKRRKLPNDIKGDPHYDKNPDSFRLLTQNAHGLRILTQDKWKAMVEQMQTMKCDIVGISETQTNWNLNNIKQTCQRTLQTAFRNSSMFVSTTTLEHDRPYLPGGTATISLGEWNSKIANHLFDPLHMGRWTGNSYCLSANSRLHDITGYRPCVSTSKASNSLATHTQQVMMLTEQGFTDPNQKEIIRGLNRICPQTRDYRK